jgi:predicted Rossmann fold nucleotide-binding protein DprA/Smf involved in DNA uptake
MVIVKGPEKSGAFITAGHAAAQGRTAFAVPGQLDSPAGSASALARV